MLIYIFSVVSGILVMVKVPQKGHYTAKTHYNVMMTFSIIVNFPTVRKYYDNDFFPTVEALSLRVPIINAAVTRTNSKLRQPGLRWCQNMCLYLEYVFK